jgi:hypothetical protein
MNIYPIILIHNIKLGSSTYVKKCSYSVNLVQDPFFTALITSLLAHLFRGRQGSPIWDRKEIFRSTAYTKGSEKRMIF